MDSSQRTILIVDDEPDFVELLMPRLHQLHFRVITAADGPDGLALARREHPAVILLDVTMPTMSGYEVCRELKNDPATVAIPVILVTAKAQHHDRQFGFESGADDYLTKPFSMQDLLARVQRFVGA